MNGVKRFNDLTAWAYSGEHVWPYAALLFGLMAIGSSAILVKWADAPGAVTGFYRMVIAAAVIALPFGMRARREVPFSRRHLWFAIIAGLFFALDLTTWNTAVMIGNAANATLLGNTSPIWVSFGAMLFFKERLRPSFWGALLFTLFGVIIILGEDFLIHPALGTGDLLGLLAGFFYGMFFLATERARDRLSSLASWWISAATSSAALFALTLVFQQSLVGYSLGTFGSLITLALLTQVAGWLAINYALGHLPASLVSPTLLGQPVITAVLAVPLLNQPLTMLQIAGGLIVLVGIFIIHRTHVQA